MGQCSSSVAAGPALDGLVPTLRVGNRIEVRDPRALNLDAGGAYRINAERCGEGWAPPKPSNGPFWYCPRRGYWWPASVIATDRARGIKVHYDGYSSRWDAWISDSHIDCAEVRLACSSSGLEAPPADGCAVEVQLVQNAPFWAPGTVRGRSADGRVLVELSVDRSHRYFAPSNCDRVTVPLRMLRVVGAPTGSPTPTVALPAAIAVSGAGVSAVNGVYVRDGTYGGVPLYKNGQVWLLRYRLPAGMHFWYLADKDRLDVDDGDYYRILSEEEAPPLDGSRWMLARDGRNPTPRFEPMAEAPPPAVGMPVVGPVVQADLNNHDLPVVTGEAVLPPHLCSALHHCLSSAQSAAPPPGVVRQHSAAGAPPPPLAAIVTILRHELGIPPEENLKSSVEQAAGMLGVETGGKRLPVVATECWRALGSPPPPDTPQVLYCATVGVAA